MREKKLSENLRKIKGRMRFKKMAKKKDEIKEEVKDEVKTEIKGEAEVNGKEGTAPMEVDVPHPPEVTPETNLPLKDENVLHQEPEQPKSPNPGDAMAVEEEKKEEGQREEEVALLEKIEADSARGALGEEGSEELQMDRHLENARFFNRKRGRGGEVREGGVGVGTRNRAGKKETKREEASAECIREKLLALASKHCSLSLAMERTWAD